MATSTQAIELSNVACDAYVFALGRCFSVGSSANTFCKSSFLQEKDSFLTPEQPEWVNFPGEQRWKEQHGRSDFGVAVIAYAFLRTCSLVLMIVLDAFLACLAEF